MSHLRAVLPEFIDLNVDMIIVDEQANARDLCSRAFAEYRTGAINFEESTTLLRSSAKGALDRVGFKLMSSAMSRQPQDADMDELEKLFLKLS